MDALCRFCFRITASKIKNVQVFLPLKESLVATFSEAYALTCRINVAEKDIAIPNLSQTLRLLWSHCSIFALENEPQKCQIVMALFSKKAHCWELSFNFQQHFQKKLSGRYKALDCFYFLRDRNSQK